MNLDFTLKPETPTGEVGEPTVITLPVRSNFLARIGKLEDTWQTEFIEGLTKNEDGSVDTSEFSEEDKGKYQGAMLYLSAKAEEGMDMVPPIDLLYMALAFFRMERHLENSEKNNDVYNKLKEAFALYKA